MKPILVTSGEPAGIGPDICLGLVNLSMPVVVMADKEVLAERAEQLGLTIKLIDYELGMAITSFTDNTLFVLSHACEKKVVAGKLDVENAKTVLSMLSRATDLCLQEQFSALVTAPIQKSIINKIDSHFSGHTTYLAQCCGGGAVVMLLVGPHMKVALATMHVPLSQVSKHLTQAHLLTTINVLYKGLQQDFNLAEPVIHVAGLNPHAGENGHLGEEELTIIKPVLSQLVAKGTSVYGPFSADTLFLNPHLPKADAFLAMYHDQGLPVFKYANFGQSVNVTLGLPIIRTSVDHGTALHLAGSGKASPSSLVAAIDLAKEIVKNRMRHLK